MFCDKMDVEKSQRAPFRFFFGIETFLDFFHQRVPFFDVLKQWMLINAEVRSFGFFVSLITLFVSLIP